MSNTLITEALARYDEKVSELKKLIVDGEETDLVEFGYKHQIKNEVHVVPDFGNIRTFIETELQNAIDKIRDEERKYLAKSLRGFSETQLNIWCDKTINSVSPTERENK